MPWHRSIRPASNPAPLERWRRGLTLQRAGTDQPPLLDLASNDYLGLSRHPAVVDAAAQALQQDGVGSGGSRLVTGSRPRHARLEQDLAAWLNRDCVLLFPSGFQANLAAVCALVDRHSTVLADRLIHHPLPGRTGQRSPAATLPPQRPGRSGTSPGVP